EIARAKVPSSKFKTQRSRLSSLKVFNYLARRIRARPACYPTAGMRAGSAKIKPPDRSPVLRPTDQRAKSKKLIERLLAVMNMPATHSVSLLQVERRNHLSRHNQFLQIRCITTQDINHIVGKFFTPRVPIAFFQLVRRILNVDRHHLSACRSQRGIEQ